MTIQLSLLLFILTILTKLAGAQIYPPQPGDLKLTTPFDFIVNQQPLPAGDYIVRWENTSNQLQICEDGINCRTTEAVVIAPSQIPSQTTLIFESRGRSRSLRQIWFPDGTGLRFSDDDAELKLTAESADPIFLNAEPLCIHQNEGSLPSWH
jgi:hypothetical protein